jgi:hypothetical protein
MRIRDLFSFLFCILMTFAFAQNSWSYQEIEVKNGGSITGKTYLHGETPEPRVYHLVLFPNIDMCAEVDTDDEMNRVLLDFKTDSNRGLRDVVVTLEKVEAGKPFNKKPISILSENCKFFPDVNIVRQDEVFKVDNQDAVMHNSQVYQQERGKIITNLPVPPETIIEGKVTFIKEYQIFQMICGMHEFMQTWGYRVQNPYYHLTGNDGSYSLTNIPPGEYKLVAWHYLMKKVERMVKIEPNAKLNIDIEFIAGGVIRPHYETIKSGRIKKDAIVPGSAKEEEASPSKK